MTLHYFWIEKSNGIYQQPVNLSSRYHFKTLIDESSKEGEILITENPNYIENFFDKGNIQDITAIVGRNGSGKTSILKFILSHFPEGLSNGISDPMMVIYSRNETPSQLKLIKPSGWNINIKNETNTPIQQDDYDLFAGAYRFNDFSDLDQIDYFYYNYFLDHKTNVTNWHGLIDLSTSSLLCESRKSFVEERWSKFGIDQKEASTFDLVLYDGNEIAKAVQLRISNHAHLIPFDFPDYLNISIDYTDRSYFRGEGGLNDEVTKIINELDQINKDAESASEVVYNNLYIALLVNFFVTQFHYSSPRIVSPKTFNYDVAADSSVINNIIRFFKNLKNIKVEFDGKQVSNAHYEKLSVDALKFIALIEKLGKVGNLEVDELNPVNIKLKMTQDALKDYTDFSNLYMKVKGLTSFINFNWSGLSTGQQSFLSFMSRFYHEKEHSVGSGNLRRNLFIMIDEGDAGFHPDWQRQFFQLSINFLSELFANHRLQLVYTSNSPYIASDLTKNHILFLDRDNDKTVVLEKDNAMRETFAQNIHTLLSDTFFLNRGLVGEFAKNRINDVIKILKSDQASDNQLRFAAKLISLIGEPVIKTKLAKMYENRTGFPVDIKKEIRKTEERLNQLKKLDNDSDI